MIQMLTYTGKETEFEGSNVIVNSIHDARSLDDFEINIISLNDENMWCCYDKQKESINSIADIYSLADMVENSKKTKVVVLFPSNLKYKFNYWTSEKKYHNSCELKDMIVKMKVAVLQKLYQPFSYMQLVYENTETYINGESLEAAFYFKDSLNSLIKSTSEKTVVCKYGEVIASSLILKTYDQLIKFLEEVGLIVQKESIPDWMEEIQMFDDDKQLNVIQESEQLIAQQREIIAKAEEALERNKRYKSILYTNGSELVDVVFDILQQMFGCNLEEFEDKKVEDFSFELSGITYIGEIKGIGSNVTSTNITQLELHHSSFTDKNPDIKEENIRCILIINYQRKRPLADRDPVDQKQITLAEKYGSLIVDSNTLLQLFDKYIKGEVSRENCIDIFTNNTGLLRL